MPFIAFLTTLLFLDMTRIAPFPSGEKAAYRAHYRGVLEYTGGRYRQAENHFRQAYRFDPDNANFALAYGLALGRSGKTREAVAVLQKAQRRVAGDDPEFLEKRATALLFQGACFLYGKQPGRALEPLKAGLQLLEHSAQRELHSLTLNALGYAVLMDQGKGQHKKAGWPLHSHVHRRALERAIPYFAQAVERYPDNAAARDNFRILADSLGQDTRLDTLTGEGSTPAYTFLSMHNTLFRELGLFGYDELLFLVDISGSMVMEKVICMGATRFDVMKEMAQKMLDDVPEATLLGIGTIGGDCGTVPKLWKRAGTFPRSELRDDLRFLIPDGTTPLLTMLRAAPELFAGEVSARKSIFLISDGANTCREPGMDVCAWADSMDKKDITINILTFLSTTSNNTEAFAEYLCLAENTGGQIIYIDNYRCKPERLALDLAKTCLFSVPAFQKSACWGPAVKDLWMILE